MCPTGKPHEIDGDNSLRQQHGDVLSRPYDHTRPEVIDSAHRLCFMRGGKKIVAAVALFLFVLFSYCNLNDRSMHWIQQIGYKSFQAGTTLRCQDCEYGAADNSTSRLPSSSQVWSHATNSRSLLQSALRDPQISAIEADVIIGRDTTKRGNRQKLEVIMGHFPHKSSDLSFETFMKMVISPTSNTLRKNIKLDLKKEEVLDPVFNVLSTLQDVKSNGKIVFLNADILPVGDERIEAHAFLSTCIRFLDSFEEHNAQGEKLEFAFSLGYKSRDRMMHGFHEVDLTFISKLIREYNVTAKSAGVVLAINARLLVKNFLPFDLFLDEFHNSQILAWKTGAEPPLSQSVYRTIKGHFEEQGRADRIGFDLKIARYRITGQFYHFMVVLVFAFLACLKSVLCCG